MHQIIQKTSNLIMHQYFLLIKKSIMIIASVIIVESEPEALKSVHCSPRNTWYIVDYRQSIDIMTKIFLVNLVMLNLFSYSFPLFFSFCLKHKSSDHLRAKCPANLLCYSVLSRFLHFKVFCQSFLLFKVQFIVYCYVKCLLMDFAVYYVLKIVFAI